MKHALLFGLAVLLHAQPPAAQPGAAPVVAPESSPIRVVLNASRLSGVAPLAVFVDLTRTTASSLTSRPFHELQFTCDFRDPGASAWAHGTRTGAGGKRIGYGPVQAHVFENAGSYEVVCTASHGAVSSSARATINVIGAEGEWAGSQTLCVRASAEGSFTGCPSAADRLTDADFDNVINNSARGGRKYRRILFECGGVYQSSTAGVVSGQGPGYIGAYPIGCPSLSKPTIAGASAKIWFGAREDPLFGDWRFVDLNLDGAERAQGADAYRTIGAAKNILILRNEIRRSDIAIHLPVNVLRTANPSRGASSASIWSDIFVVDNVIEDVDNYGFLGSAARLVFAGNKVNHNHRGGGHLVRTGYCSRCIFSNNELGPSSTGNRLTIRAFGSFSSGDNLFAPGTAWTENVVVGENRILGTGFTIRAINPDDDARFRNVIVESNELDVRGGATALATDAGDLTFRNNLVYLTGAGQHNGIQVYKSAHASVPGTANDNISVLNNSVYSASQVNGNYQLVNLIATPANLVVKNNISYLPGVSGTHRVVQGRPGPGALISHNTDGADISTRNPNFATTPPTQPSHWRPTRGYAIGGGAPVPVWTDFARSARGSSTSLGAVNP